MFGVDRFYLGYPAIGCLKFATLGFFFIGHLVDVILISTQTLGPADNSSYIIPYFGPVLSKILVGENTYRKDEGDWYTDKHSWSNPVE
jgi:TM2 domain-containing membrane protein YozV